MDFINLFFIIIINVFYIIIFVYDIFYKNKHFIHLLQKIQNLIYNLI